MNTTKLFYDDILDALGEIIRAAGGPKDIGGSMRPELPPDQAAQWVRDCLNKNRREKFDPEQVQLLLRKGREIECHAAINFICDDAGYSRPTPVNPVDAQTQRIDEFNRRAAELAQLGAAIQQNGGTAALRVVKP